MNNCPRNECQTIFYNSRLFTHVLTLSAQLALTTLKNNFIRRNRTHKYERALRIEVQTTSFVDAHAEKQFVLTNVTQFKQYADIGS